MFGFLRVDVSGVIQIVQLAVWVSAGCDLGDSGFSRFFMGMTVDFCCLKVGVWLTCLDDGVSGCFLCK